MNITEIFGILLTIIIKKFLLAIQPIQKKQKKKQFAKRASNCVTRQNIPNNDFSCSVLISLICYYS